jgi:methylglyoxal synthase
MDKRRFPSRKRIALVAHDKKKAELIEWIAHNRELLSKHELFATGTTGKLIEKELGLNIKKLFSGPLGGDQQIGAMIAEGKMDIIIFYWDPLEMQPHDSDVKALLRIAVAWNIIIACNRTTADFILTSQLMNEDYTLILPDYTEYLSREPLSETNKL